MQSDSFSLDAQLRQIKEQAERDGVEIVKVFADPAQSAYRKKYRPGINAMREAARRGEFKMLYVHKVDRLARRLATVKTSDREIVLRDVPVGESPYNLLQQVNAALAQSCQPFVAWRLEWVSDEIDRLWPEGAPQIRNEHGSAYVTGYAHDEAGNLVYLGMVGHKTVLESIRATVQARQRRKLFLQGRPVYPLPTHYCQVWQHLPDYGAYHATLIADPSLLGKWQPGEEVIYLLAFENELPDGSTPETQAQRMLTSRLSETLPIPILDEWHTSLWVAGQGENLIVGLESGGDCQEGYLVQLAETLWKEVIARLLKERKIRISGS